MRGCVDTQSTSQMEVFHVMHTEMPAQQTIGAAPLLLFMHISHVIMYKDGCGEGFLSRTPIRDTFN